MYPDLKPKFAKRFAEVGEQIAAATRDYVEEVQNRTFPAAEHTFKPNGVRRRVPSMRPAGADSVLEDSEIPPHWQTH
jgi:3-methyl-2-oxobutanoate hydroxymethyltransferase